MKQMGISQDEIPANRVIIEQDDKNIIINNPHVVKIDMQGTENFQISGDITEEQSGVSEEDIKQVVEKTGKSEDQAKSALEQANGDLAEAILSLT